MRQGRRGFGPRAQPRGVHSAGRGLPRAVLPGQGQRYVSVGHGVPPGEVLALRAPFAEVFHAAVAGPAEFEVLAVALASGTGGAQVLQAGIHRGLWHCWDWVAEVIDGVLERQGLEGAGLAQGRVQRPSHLGCALGRALGLPQLLDAGHLGDGQLAPGQAQRHVQHDGRVVHLGGVRVLQVHEGDAPPVRKAAVLLLLLRVRHALGGGLLHQQQGLPPEVAICVVLARRLEFMQITVERERTLNYSWDKPNAVKIPQLRHLHASEGARAQ